MLDLAWHRKVVIEIEEPELAHQVRDAREILKEVYPRLPRPSISGLPKDLSKTSVSKLVKVHKELKKKVEAGEAPPEMVTMAAFLKDYINLCNLTGAVLHLPDPKGGEEPLYYCELPENVGGVTAKATLCGVSKVRDSLAVINSLDAGEIASDYLESREAFKLSVDGMLKLPKHGEVEEVQREAIALNLSKRLGHKTTENVMVSYQGKPALFVPFEQIELLKCMAEGEERRAFDKFWKTYFVASTIKPVGEGHFSDDVLSSFGCEQALFFLCGDPDFIGGYNQNKAIFYNRDLHGEATSNRLFVFDQVVKPDETFVLGIDLNLVPTSEKTRHVMGRNRTLINDSSYRDRVQGLFAAIDMAQFLIDELQGQIDEQRALVDSPEARGQSFTKHTRTMLKDTDDLRKKLKRRCDVLRNIVVSHPLAPLIKEKRMTRDQFKQALLVERLLNRPRLFDQYGKPYKYPNTTVGDISVIGFSEVGSDDSAVVKLSLSSPHDRAQVAAFVDRLRGVLGAEAAHDGNPLVISKQAFAQLTDTASHPEMQTVLVDRYDYLDGPKFHDLMQTYPDIGNTAKLHQVITDYQRRSTVPSVDFVGVARDARQDLDQLLRGGGDKGLACHVRRLYTYDLQQRLVNISRASPDEDFTENLKQVFSRMMKLDRVDVLQDTLLLAIEKGQLVSPEVKECVAELAVLADCTTYAAAQTKSEEVFERCQVLQQQLTRGLHHEVGQEVDIRSTVAVLGQLSASPQAERGIKMVSLPKTVDGGDLLQAMGTLHQEARNVVAELVGNPDATHGFGHQEARQDRDNGIEVRP